MPCSYFGCPNPPVASIVIPTFDDDEPNVELPLCAHHVEEIRGSRLNYEIEELDE